MAQVITFESFRPVARYDGIAWTQARVEEGTTADGPWTVLETIALSPVDSDPRNPDSRNFTTELADDAMDLWYRIVFLDASGDSLQPTEPIQNVASDVEATGDTYATVDELARILKVRAPSADQVTALGRVLLMATGEIDSEIDLAAGADALAGWQIALVTEVCLERGAELWKEQEVQFGLVGIGTEFGPTRIARDTWDKYALKLAPLKNQWGLA